MRSLTAARALAAFVTLAAALGAQAAQARLGFAVSAETDGLFSTTLKSVKITSVVPGAPAEQAGLRAGDDVEAVNEVPIAGTAGSKIMDIVHAVKPGEHIRFKVRRDGAERTIDIVAGPAAK